MTQNKILDPEGNRLEKRSRSTDKDRVVDLLERIGAVFLYTTTSLGQTDIAKALGMDNNRINNLLKGIKKTK